MPSSIERIRAELAGMGIETIQFQATQGEVIAFQYRIETGSHAGETVMIGVSSPDGEYPEYPPHWVHVSPPIDDRKGGATELYAGDDGRQWLAMSRPPGDLWDALRTKHMAYYISEHLRRIWKDV